MNSSDAPATVSGLFIHPVKSGRARAVSRTRVDYFGMVEDRRLMVVDEHGTSLTQRTLPGLAAIEAEFDEAHRSVALSTPRLPRISVNLRPAQPAALPVVIWGDHVDVTDLGDEVARWLHACLGREARLVTLAPEYSRPVRRNGEPGDEVSFTDAFPLLLISEPSLATLNERLDAPVPMNRFRPNVVISGCRAHAEDEWKRIRIGDCILRAAGPSSRCSVITIDQQTLLAGKEPLATLATYRRGGDGKIYFGQNYINETKRGGFAIADVVEVLA
ncbi:MAG: MOSC domain-containing protein [Opitutaceae bacterium]